MKNVFIDDALLIRYFSDDATPEERLAVNEWIEESVENQRMAERIYYIKYAGDTVHAMRSIDVHADLAKVWKKIRNRSARLWIVWMQRAAAVACLFLIPAFIYVLARDKHHHLSGAAMYVPEGSISSAVLPDGSKVWLNAGSRLSYNQGYGISNRKIQLSGEGLFEVSANARLPFEVDVNDMTVRARGTQFNVKAYPDDHTVRATLTEGVVEIISPGKEKIVLHPGQMAVYDRSSRQLSMEPVVKTELHTSWKDRRWLIEGTTLGELAPILQRRYAVKVVFDNEALKAYKFRGEIPKLTAEQMAKTLQLTAPMNYRISNDTVFFTFDLKRKKEYDKILK